MRGRRTSILLTFVIGSLLLSSCSVFFGDDEKAVEDSTVEEIRVPDTLMRSFVRTAHDAEGRILWQIKAREGRVFNDVNRIYVTDFILYSFADDGSLRSTFRARRGVIDNNSGITTGRIKVVLRAENGRVLETSEVHVNNNDKIIYNDVLNKITQEDGTVMIGTHLWAHSDLKVFKLKGTQGEAPEGAGDGLFGEEAQSSSVRSSARPETPSSVAAISRPSSLAGAGLSSRSAGSSSNKTEGEGNAFSFEDWRLRFPDPELDEFERIRMKIAFPASSASSSSASSSGSSASVSSVSNGAFDKGTNS